MVEEAASRPPLAVGDVVGDRYQLVRELGAGAMGAVYEARHTSTGRRVALKVIVEELLRHAKAHARFEVEARASGAIDSEYVVQTLDVGVDHARGTPFLAMELLVGEDLEVLLGKTGTLPPDVVVRLGIQCCLGLEKAHAAGVLHRDIKPANLFLAERDGGEIRVKLVDFGIAKILAPEAERANAKGLTRTGQLLGSPLYMSPEQVYSGKTVDAQTDVWSLGSVLYEALVGAAPFQHLTTVPELLVSIGSVPVAPLRDRAPWVPEAVAAVVERALVIDKAARHRDASAFRRALEALAPGGWALRKHELVKAPPPTDDAGPTHFASAAMTAMPSTDLAPKPAQGVVRQPVAPPPTVATPQRTQHQLPQADSLVTPVAAQPAAVPPAPAPVRPAPSGGGGARWLVVGVLAVVGVGLGAVAVRALVASPAQARSASSPHGEPSPSHAAAHASPSPVASHASQAHPPTHAPSVSPLLAPLEGRWTSFSGNEFVAVSTPEGVEFRIVVPNPKVGTADYRKDERRFTIKERDGGLFVVDHLRPAAPLGARYTDGSRSACLRSFESGGGKPLRAVLTGDDLKVDLAKLSWDSDGAMFQVEKGEIASCPGLDTLPRGVVQSKLSKVAK